MWTVNMQEVTACSLCPQLTIYLSPLLYDKIEILMDFFPHQEWATYLEGEQKGSDVFIQDLVFPPQVADGSHAEPEPLSAPSGCIGFLHSHHGMGIFRSNQDADCADRNYLVSIIVARTEGTIKFDAVSFRKTQCDKGIVQKAQVRLVKPHSLFDVEKFLTDVKSKMKAPKPFSDAVIKAILSKSQSSPLDGEEDDEDGEDVYDL